MDWIDLLIGFFVANVLGYGGGPASIPLMYQEIVIHHHWATDAEFANILALGNALPGPIATKIAAFTGYDISGWFGMAIALIATVVPSALALILMLKILKRHSQSPVVKGMALLVQPVIAIMMVVLTWQMAAGGMHSLGIWQSIVIAGIALWAMERRKIHPAFVIIGAFAYGGAILPHFP